MFALLLSVLSVLLSQLIFEPFDEDVIGTRWYVSKDERYNGTWAVENRAADFSNGSVKGLVAKSPSQSHGISMKKEVAANADTFVLQFEHKAQAASFGCGGSYIKVLSEDFNPLEFNNRSPYAIMFGPDKCGETNQIHFIYRTQNLLSKYWGEHKLKTKVPGLYDNVTHLYTLIINEDDSFVIKVDNQAKANGSLHDPELFDSPFEPPKFIPDTTDHKPVDWVDAEEIPDVNDTKPDDWDETAPPTIPDPDATKPDNWKEDEPLQVIDTKTEKPNDWNEEEDGPFQAPMIDNPYCAEHGCGPWTPPQIKNPLYKGKWKPKMVPNPLYKGKWKARDVENPYHFVPEHTLHQVGTIYGLGFELVSPVEQWFSSIYVGHSVQEAEDLANNRWAGVNKEEVAAKAKAAASKADADSLSKKLPELVGNLKKGGWAEAWNIVTDFYYDSPIITILLVVVIFSALILLVVCCACCCCCGGSGGLKEGGGVKEKEGKGIKTGESKNKKGTAGGDEKETEEEEKEEEEEEEEEEDEDEQEDEGEDEEKDEDGEEEEKKEGKKPAGKGEKTTPAKTAPKTSPAPPSSASSTTTTPKAATPTPASSSPSPPSSSVSPPTPTPVSKESGSSSTVSAASKKEGDSVKERKGSTINTSASPSKKSPQEQPKPQPVKEEDESEQVPTTSTQKKRKKGKTQYDD